MADAPKIQCCTCGKLAGLNPLRNGLHSHRCRTCTNFRNRLYYYLREDEKVKQSYALPPKETKQTFARDNNTKYGKKLMISIAETFGEEPEQDEEASTSAGPPSSGASSGSPIAATSPSGLARADAGSSSAGGSSGNSTRGIALAHLSIQDEDPPSSPKAKRRRLEKAEIDDLIMAQMRLSMCSSYLEFVITKSDLESPALVDAYCSVNRMKSANVTLLQCVQDVVDGADHSRTSGGRIALLDRVSEQCDLCCVVGDRIATGRIPFEPTV